MDNQKQPTFIAGLKLAEGFFHEEVKPILRSHYPALRYSAALIGSGSEVLGFDDEMSLDHHWGPRVMLFLRPSDLKHKGEAIKSILSEKLPLSYLGYSVNFSQPNPNDHGTQTLQSVNSGPVNHRVEIHTIHRFFLSYLKIDVRKELSPIDWLTLPHQKLRSIIAGRVFYDDLGLEEIRARFAWYPQDVWLYVLASDWARIGQEEHLMGRAGIVGDEIGSSLIGSRLVRDIMRLAFLMEKEYPPYPKWFGTAFSQLKSGAKLGPILTKALHSTAWQGRESYLCQAYEILVTMHNKLKITEPVSSKVSQFFGRPFKVIWGEKIANALIDCIKDQKIVSQAKRSPIGSIDMISDNTDMLEDPLLAAKMRTIYK